jgi:hypothetical protein
MAEDLIVFEAPVTVYSDPELAYATSQTASGLDELLSDNPAAKEFSEDLRSGYDQLHAAGVKDLSNPETGNKINADALRDRRYLGFRSKTETLTYEDDSTVAADASSILDLISKRGYSMQNFGLKKQTSAMDGLILDLDVPKHRETMNKLDILKAFESMSQAQKAFKLAEENQTRAATEISNPSLVAARKYVRTIITECNSWLATRLRKEPQVITPMVQRWNEIFATISAQAHARGTRKENSQNETVAQPEPAVSQV